MQTHGYFKSQQKVKRSSYTHDSQIYPSHMFNGDSIVFLSLFLLTLQT